MTEQSDLRQFQTKDDIHINFKYLKIRFLNLSSSVYFKGNFNQCRGIDAFRP